MPKLVKFYIMHCAIGFAVAGVFTALILYYNVANLWHLISGSDIGLMAVLVFWILNGIVFAGVQFGVAVMLLSDGTDEDSGPRGGSQIGEMVPVRVAAEQRNPKL